MRSQRLERLVVLAPGLAVLLGLLLVPALLLTGISFLQRGADGSLAGPPSLANYVRFLGFGGAEHDPIYLRILWRSIVLGLITTLLTVLIGYPFAFAIAASRRRHLLLVATVVPFWTNFAVRIHAWMVLCQHEGVINALLGAFGADPVRLLPSTTAVYLGTLYTHLPFLVLPVYAAVERIDWHLAEAAADLGASPWRVFCHAIYPQTTSGLIAGALLVFIPATGTFVISDLLGGGKTMLVGNLVQQQFASSRDFAFGAACATMLLVVVLLGLCIVAFLARRRRPQ